MELKKNIYKALETLSFNSIGKNDIKHQDILKTFVTEEKDNVKHYAEVYSEVFGFSVYVYGEGFMDRVYPTVFHIIEQIDVKKLIESITKVFDDIQN